MHAGGISAQYPVFGRSPIGGEVYGAVPYSYHQSSSSSTPSPPVGVASRVATVYPGDLLPQNTVTTARPPDYMTLAVITTLCCNVCFGLVALVFSVASDSASDVGDYDAGRRHGKMSLMLSLVGATVTVTLITAFIIYACISSMEVAEKTVDGWATIEAHAHDLEYAEYHQ